MEAPVVKKVELKVEPIDEGGETCEICYLNYVSADMYGLKSCSHKFCLNCIVGYLEYNI
jgi:hypothetical protein